MACPLPSPSRFTPVARFVFSEPGHRCGCCWISAADLHLQGKGRGAGVPCAVPLPRSAPRRGAILPRPHPRCVPRGRGRKRNRSAVRKGPGAGAGWEHGISGAGGGGAGAPSPAAACTGRGRAQALREVPWRWERGWPRGSSRCQAKTLQNPKTAPQPGGTELRARLCAAASCPCAGSRSASEPGENRTDLRVPAES